MAGKFYYKYIPVRRGLTGVEYLAGFLDEQYPGVKFDGVISDGLAEFGILSGSGDIFAKAIAAIEGRFSAVRLDELTFVGSVARHYNATGTTPDGHPVPTLAEFLAAHGVTVPADTLNNIKAAKLSLFKEVVKRKFRDDNDNISDLAKAVTLLTLHYPTLSTAEKATVDTLSSVLKSVYTKDACLSAYSDMVNNFLSTALSGYYVAKTQVDNATTTAQVDAVTYE